VSIVVVENFLRKISRRFGIRREPTGFPSFLTSKYPKFPLGLQPRV